MTFPWLMRAPSTTISAVRGKTFCHTILPRYPSRGRKLSTTKKGLSTIKIERGKKATFLLVYSDSAKMVALSHLLDNKEQGTGGFVLIAEDQRLLWLHTFLTKHYYQ